MPVLFSWIPDESTQSLPGLDLEGDHCENTAVSSGLLGGRGSPRPCWAAKGVCHRTSRSESSSATRKRLKEFVKRKLSSYPQSRNHPDADGTSGLSPYLHFGHISVHEIFRELAKAEGWSPGDLSEKATGVYFL